MNTATVLDRADIAALSYAKCGETVGEPVSRDDEWMLDIVCDLRDDHPSAHAHIDADGYLWRWPK